MEFSEFETPQKIKANRILLNCQQQNAPVTASDGKMTPKNAARGCAKTLHPRTPKAQSLSYCQATSISMLSNNASGLHSVSLAVVQSPPAKRYQKIRNPFEAALAERLHLPLIGSPSLFQCPVTPQMSSTQCEWTIDEVSSMMPANVEPHETQFHDSPDPELEAKAQLAISSYFKEQQIVPSPVDCPLRSHRIVLQDISGHTPLSKPGRRIRDCSSQTELTLPPILPAALEEALKPYFQPHLAGESRELKKSGFCFNTAKFSGSNEAKDTSLRRKLFDIHNVMIWDNNEMPQTSHSSGSSSSGSRQQNSSPIALQHTAIAGKLSDSLDKSSFGSLSPISAHDGLSPALHSHGSATRRKSRFDHLRSELEELEQLSPIHPPIRRKLIEDKTLYRSQENKENNLSSDTSQQAESEHFTPERSSSPFGLMCTKNIAEMSADSFNIKVSRLQMNSSGKERYSRTAKGAPLNSLQEVDIFMCQDDTVEDVLECTGETEDMQVSQLSMHSSNCSSSRSDTPRGKRRSASRKNLSQSFSANWLLEDEEENDEVKKTTKPLTRAKEDDKQMMRELNVPKTQLCNGTTANDLTPKKGVNFYRTDSGFNELSQNSSGSQDGAANAATAAAAAATNAKPLACCSSTPSTRG